MNSGTLLYVILTGIIIILICFFFLDGYMKQTNLKIDQIKDLLIEIKSKKSDEQEKED